MISRWRLRLTQLTQQMWFRTSLLAIVGVLAALLAARLDPMLPEHLPTKIGADAVLQILNILASSMLAVTTFSLSTMVTAFGAATSNATPRATRLIMKDTTTQNILAVFLGTFLFALVGIIALNTGYYSDRGRFLLFIVSIGVVGLVVVTMLRWIDHLTRLGRVSETTERVEHATMEAIQARLKAPLLGGRRLDKRHATAAAGGASIKARKIGYIAFVDLAAIQAAADQAGRDICLDVLPGSFVHPARTLAHVVARSPGDQPLADAEQAELSAKIHDAFDIETQRSFSQDPRYGISVLSEIASRALSPAVNDPGTAIDVVGRGVRLLAAWIEPTRDRLADDSACSNVFVPALQAADLFDDFFTPIARDGAGVIEVQIRLQKALCALSRLGGADAQAAAIHHAREALERAEFALTVDADRIKLRDLARRIERAPAAPV